MDRRLKLQTLLEELLGTRNVYFQPPATLKINYPAIVYARDNVWSVHAENLPYAHKKRYQVTVIDANPDSPIPGKVAKLPMSSFSRNFVTDNLNHDIYNLYF